MPIVRRSAAEIRRRKGRANWEQVRRITDEEIARQTRSNPDTAPELGRLEDVRRVYNPPVPDVTAIRRRLGLSQAAFARRFGLSLRTLQQWEQGRGVPDRPARILLRVIETAPRAVERAVAG